MLEAKYDGNIMYSCMKMEKWDLLNYSRNEGEGIKENDAGGEFNYNIL
jgi:hypothetical protein